MTSPYVVDPARPEDLVRDEPGVFRVHGRAYTDQAIFDLEDKLIFGRSWVYVAHESEIEQPGDFKSTHIGQQPVLVTRSDDGAINVLLNRCVHRGAAVCRERSGNSPRGFTCPYHAWSYAIDGRLTGITGRNDPSGYAEDFQAPEGLRRVPRVESYRGFVFASFDKDIVPLPEYLGSATVLLDRKLAQSSTGKIRLVSNPYIGVYKGNWKFQAENIVDGYHFLYAHQSFVKLQHKYGDTTGDFGVHKGGTPAEMRQNRNRGDVLGLVHGHGVNQKPVVGYDDMFTGEFADYFEGLRQRYGDEELSWVTGAGAGCLFPNFGIIHNQLRVWRPLAPGLTEVTVYPYELDGAPDAYNAGMLRSQERFYGPAGHGAVDDVEIFAVNQQGLGASVEEWLIMERGMHTETVLDSGEVRGLPSSETVHRAFWRHWRRLMTQR